MGKIFYFDWEISLIVWLQDTLGAAGKYIATFFTYFGESLVIVGFLGFVYWCYDKELGKKMGLLIVTGLVMNPLIKNIFIRKRPYMVSPDIKCLKPVDASADIYDIAIQGYSFPSGHSFNSFVFYNSLVIYKKIYEKRKIVAALLIALPFMVGLSRVILGNHFPTDVMFGWLSGAVLMFALAFAEKRIKRIWILYLVIMLISLVGLLYCRTKDYYTGIGLMAGFFAADLFERRYVNFENTRSIPECIIRLAGGAASYLIVSTLIKLPFSESFLKSQDFSALMLVAFRYMVSLFVAIGVYPMVFRKIRIGRRDTDINK